MKTSYQVVSSKDRRQLSEFLAREGQFLLPMLDLITQAEMAVDELIDVAGRATIEAVLTLSAQDVAGAKHPGRKAESDIRWHGRQKGVVCLAERKLRVNRPRLRRKGGGHGHCDRHRHHGRYRSYGYYGWYGGPYFGYGYYGDRCGWLYRRAVATGSPYWWDRYYDCIGYY